MASKVFLDIKIQLKEGQRSQRIACGRFLWEGLEVTQYTFTYWLGTYHKAIPCVCQCSDLAVCPGKEEINFVEHNFSARDGGTYFLLYIQ